MTEKPSKWDLVTNLDHHLIYQQTEPPPAEPRKTLVLLNSGRPSTWKIKGLIGFNEDSQDHNSYPIFADNTTLEKAKTIAHDVMDENLDISPIRREAIADKTQDQDTGANNNSDRPDSKQNKTEANTSKDSTSADPSGKDNAELTDFM